VLRVLGAVVDDEQRQRLVGLRAVRGPEVARHLCAQEPRADRDVLQRPGRRLLVVEPDRPLVPVELEHRALAERVARAKRVRRIRDPFGRAAGALDLELVLDAREAVRPRELEEPGARASPAAELRRREPLERVAPQPDRLHVGGRRAVRERESAHTRST
jgi:hypothetical protein